MGAVSAVPYWVDMTVSCVHGIAGLVISICDAAMQMYALLNGRERMMGGFVDVCGQAEWKIVQVYHLPGSLSSEIVAAPG
jgi:hypothetical protein